MHKPVLPRLWTNVRGVVSQYLTTLGSLTAFLAAGIAGAYKANSLNPGISGPGGYLDTLG